MANNQVPGINNTSYNNNSTRWMMMMIIIIRKNESRRPSCKNYYLIVFKYKYLMITYRRHAVGYVSSNKRSYSSLLNLNYWRPFS